MVFANQFHVFHGNPDFYFFCTANSSHHEIMFWLEGAEVEGSYFRQKNYHPSNSWCCLINSVNSTLMHTCYTCGISHARSTFAKPASWGKQGECNQRGQSIKEHKKLHNTKKHKYDPEGHPMISG